MFTDRGASAGAVAVHGNAAPQKSSLAPSLVGFQPAVASAAAPLAAVHTHTQSSNPIPSTATQSRVKYCTEDKRVCTRITVTLPRKTTASCFTDNNVTTHNQS